MNNPINYWYQKYLALKAKMDEMMAGDEHLASVRKMMGGGSEIPNNLNEMADYARKQAEELLVVIKKYDYYSDEQIEELRTHLMAMFFEGTDWQKEQMMKEARNHFVLRVLSDNTIKKMIELYNDEVDCKFGDRVRIIIVKEEKNGTRRA